MDHALEESRLWVDAMHCGTTAESRSRDEIRSSAMQRLFTYMVRYRDNQSLHPERDFYPISFLLGAIHITCGNEEDITRACGVIRSFQYAKSKDLYPEEISRLHSRRPKHLVDETRKQFSVFQSFPSNLHRYFELSFSQKQTCDSISAQSGLNFISECIANPMTILEVRIRSDDAELYDLYVKQAKEFNSESEGERNAGFDIICPTEAEANGQVHQVQHNVSVVATQGGVAQPWLLMPRSSLYKTPFRLCNSVGLMDSGYRGDVKAMFDVLSPGQTVRGNRYVQAVGLYSPIEFVRVLRSDEPFSVSERTRRGEGGFGSTG